MFGSRNIVGLSFALSFVLLLSSCQTVEQRQMAEANCALGKLAACDRQFLCALASAYKDEFGFSSIPNGPKVWKPGMKKWGDEARRRGYSCGVK